ncbi:tryptophan halogenase family protein [Sphingomonas sp.]|jgi:tryptophan halogenase|uniref:tryptophan halogenase family protein n=1 Tax=Sphingomonas sp. TaxID=28214 RepID=UPI002E31EED0|nr:tryptophan halogenase family protein [Sphingomonas sp.]HEX4695623.1 tryptophan halogenase family protein [Sphingomonas sp.]
MNTAEPAPIKSVTIVGGGTAGWMTAALLSQVFSSYRIRLIESEEIGIIGVGEATIPSIRNYNDMAGIDQVEMIRATQGTFKLGIDFVNWRNGNDRYFHGFGRIGHDFMWLHPHQLWMMARQAGRAQHFDNYALNCVAGMQNKFSYPDPANPASPLGGLDYAYNFDASVFAKYLRVRSEANGVARIEGKIVDVKLDSESGNVDHVVMEDGRTVDGDLFVDCSGMRALLIGQALGIGYEDWNHWLLNDRALAVPCERTEPLTPYTRVSARKHGWQWRIPLQHRTGNGHVYSSSHLSDDEAASVLLANLDAKPLGEPRSVRFRPGKRRKAWEKNVVAIGLSSGFLEPLESTSIHLIQTGITKLLGLFPRLGFAAADVAEYNRQHDFEFADVRDFIVAHYKVTDREDTPYWAYLKNMAIPDSLAERLDLFASSGRFYKRAAAELFRVESWVQVLLGQGFAMGHDPNAAIVPRDVRTSYLADIEEVNADAAARMPDHAAFIDRYCKAPALTA